MEGGARGKKGRRLSRLNSPLNYLRAASLLAKSSWVSTIFLTVRWLTLILGCLINRGLLIVRKPTRLLSLKKVSAPRMGGLPKRRATLRDSSEGEATARMLQRLAGDDSYICSLYAHIIIV
jgi:hypothetical protein